MKGKKHPRYLFIGFVNMNLFARTAATHVLPNQDQGKHLISVLKVKDFLRSERSF